MTMGGFGKTSDRARTSRVAVALLAILGLSVGGAACGGDSDTGAAANSAGPDPLVITIEDFAFSPADLRVPPGSVVTVVNEDDAPHTATADDGSFDSAELDQGESNEITLPETGEVAFHCAIHDYMRGVIRIGA